MMKFVTLGTSHGDPTRERFNTSTLLDAEECGILFDAGAPVNALLIRRGAVRKAPAFVRDPYA